MTIWYKINRFITKRITVLFILFLLINIVSAFSWDLLITDILSHFRLQYFFCSIIFILFFVYLSFFYKKYIIGAVLSLLLAFFNFIDLSEYIFRGEIKAPGNTIKVGLFNVLTRNLNYDSALKEIKDNNPDIIIMQETDLRWINAVKILKKSYPYYIEHPRYDNFGIAMYSKLPCEKMDIEYWSKHNLPVVYAEILKDNEKIKIYAVHTLPPVSKDNLEVRNDMFKKIKKIIEENPDKLIIAGDFNSTVYSSAYKKYIKTDKIYESQQIAGNLFTGSWNAYHYPFLRITLEHILSTKDIIPVMYKQGNFFGSDHFPVFAEFNIISSQKEH